MSKKKKVAKRQAAWYRKNKNKVAKQHAAYWRKNKKRMAKQKSVYRRKNKNKIAKKKATYYLANKKKIAKQQAEYQRKNKKKIVKRQEAWYKKNKSKEAQRAAAYYLANKKKIAAYYRANKKKITARSFKRNRTAATRYSTLLKRHKKQLAPRGCAGQPMTLKAYRKKLYFADGRERPCWYCRGENNKAGSGLDRLDNNKTYTVANTVPACRGCNVWRGNTHSVQETRDHFAPMRDAAKRKP